MQTNNKALARTYMSAKQTGPLTMDELRVRVPSAFAETAAPTMTDRYRYIPTSGVIETLMQTGFVPVRAGETKVRIEGQEGFARHMIVFQHQDTKSHGNYDQVMPQQILVNAHNGTSALKLYQGLFRVLCGNGLIVVDGNITAITIRHSGRKAMLENAINGAYALIERTPLMIERIAEWQTLEWDVGTMRRYAKEASKLRWADGAPFDEGYLLAARSYDNTQTVWHTFNRVQAHLMDGGIRYWGERRRNTTRAVRSVQTDLRVNIGLWQLTADWARGNERPVRPQPEVIDAEYEVVS